MPTLEKHLDNPKHHELMSESDHTKGVVSPVPYVGFWFRVLTFLLDFLFMLAIYVGLVAVTVGLGTFRHEDGSINIELPYWFFAIYTLGFWIWKSATPGKMLIGAKIVAVDTLASPRIHQYLLRVVGYLVSAVVLSIGFFWIAFDPKKRGWHDYIGRTVVIFPRDLERTQSDD